MTKQLWDEVYTEVERRIRRRLRDYRPDLSQATGNLSPTQYPTPTGNAPGGYPPAAHTHPWSDITSTPTTLAGYGITDAQPLDSDLTAIASLATTSYGRGFLTQADAAAARSYIGAGTGSGTVTSVNITAPAAGITATGGPITNAGAITLALANDLAALESLASTGLAARTGTDTWAQRTITGTSNRISVSNGSGVSGNPTLDIDAAYVGQSSITTLGTISTGTWQGTKIGLAYGGTNADLSATGGANQIVRQNSAGGAFTVSVLAAADIPNLDSSKITTGQIPRSPLTTRGDVLTQNPSGTHTRLAIGTAATYLRSDGTDPSWHTLDAADLAYSGLTTGQVLRATGASAAAFGALDLANANAVTGILPAANGGTGINNSTRTLTVNTNAGILDFTAASLTLTIPASITALGRASSLTAGRVLFASDANNASHDGGLTWDNTNKALTVSSTSIGALTITSSHAVATRMDINSTGGQNAGFRLLHSGTAKWSFAHYDPTGGGTSYGFAIYDEPQNRIVQFILLNSDSVGFGKIPSLTGYGDIDVAGVIGGDSYIQLQEISTPAAPAANKGRLYLDDNGAGKTRLMIRFNTGSAVQIAIQP